AARHAGAHRAIPGPEVERVESAFDVDRSVAAGGLQLPVDVDEIDRTVAGVQPRVTLQTVDVDSAVTGIQLDVTGQLRTLDGTVLGSNGDITVDRGDLHGSVVRVDQQIGVPGHVNFGFQAPVIEANRDTGGDLHSQLDLVAILMGVNVHLPSEL